MKKFSWFFIWILALPSFTSELNTSLGRLEIQPVLSELDEPWSVGFLPDGPILITERGGKLIYIDRDAKRFEVQGTPETQQGGQAGLFDVLVPSDYSNSHKIYLSFADPQGRGTAVNSYIFEPSKNVLKQPQSIFVMNSPSISDIHFGARMAEATNGEIYLTLGERGDSNLAQDMSVDNGSVVRLSLDGNSYTRVSKGHRNPQGAAFDANGNLFVTEHGAMGGDELNLVEQGKNYGWPIITYGLNYNGAKIGEGTEKVGLEQPKHYWDPSMAPSGLAIHSGNNWPEAKGLIFAGSLKFNRIYVIDPQTFAIIDTIETPETLRVRDVREAPDGSLWFLSVINGAAYRIAPL